MKRYFISALEISAKTGKNVDQLLKSIIRQIPKPKIPKIEFNDVLPKISQKSIKTREQIIKKQINSPIIRGYIFDSWFEGNSGVNFIVRVFNGSIKTGDLLFIHNSPETIVEVKCVGIFDPNKNKVDELIEGSVGFIATNIKDAKFGINSLGQTICSFHPNLEPLSKAEKQKAIVFASIFPDHPDQFDDFTKAIYKILLEDPVIEIENESSKALGNGFRCGFLGELHLEVFRQRLLDEFSISTICTPPSVQYQIKTSDNKEYLIRNAADITEDIFKKIVEYREMFTKINVIARSDDISSVFALIEDHRGKVLDTTQISQQQIKITAEIPLSEIIENFNKELKLLTRGYGSFDFEFLDFRSTNVSLLKITVMDEEFDAFQFLIHKSKAYDFGKKLCVSFSENIPAQVFTVHVRAVIGGRVIAKEEIKATRKDVTAKCYGGDYSRKKKLLERQKEGKARLREIGKVQISPESINKIYKSISK